MKTPKNFTVKMIYEPDKERMLKALKTVLEQVKKNDKFGGFEKET